MHESVVSVVIPCFNQGRFLAEAVESVLAQTFRRIEIIVVEDQSTDGYTRDVVRRLAFPRTRTILNDTNRGVAATRNIGVRAARGPYILPLDADDKLAPTFVERALEKLHDGTADVCYSRVLLFGTEEGEFPIPPFSVRGMLRDNMVVNTALYRKSAWADAGGYAEAMKTGLEDWDFWLSLIEHGNRFHRVEEPLFLYRKHGVSRTDSARQTEDSLRRLLVERHKPLFIRHGLNECRGGRLPLVQRRKERLRSSFMRLTRLVFGPNFAPETSAKPPIQLHYFSPKDISNFGDQLNVDLLRSLTGRPVQSADTSQATHVCIGSLLDAFLRRRGQRPLRGAPLVIWGAGFITASGEHPAFGTDALTGDGCEEFRRPVHVCAVRGRMTLERLRAMGLPVEGVALGDPGLLAGLLLPPRDVPPARGERLRLGVVPHYVDVDEPIVSDLLRRFPSARLVRVSETPTRFLEQLASCDVVLSSSLHGLIAADSLGIPNARMRLSRRVVGGDWKFRDYYTAFGVEPKPLDHEDLGRLTEDDLARLCVTHPIDLAAVRQVADGLLASCPFLLSQPNDDRHEPPILSFPSMPDGAVAGRRRRQDFVPNEDRMRKSA